jgi:hypothetical protein
MSRRPAPFTEADIKRAVKPLLKLGLTVREVLATTEGVRVVVSGEHDAKLANPWDQP